MHDFGGVLGQRAFEYFRLGSHNATVTALGSCVMWSCVMCDVIHTSHVGFHIDIFRPLKMLWAMVQNHSRVHRKQWGGVVTLSTNASSRITKSHGVMAFMQTCPKAYTVVAWDMRCLCKGEYTNLPRIQSTYKLDSQ